MRREGDVSEQPGSATRGLATVALLKMNFDAGRDHLGMFEPFVADSVAHLQEDDFSVDDIHAVCLARHRLALPVPALRTLLGRIVRQGYANREGGRYFRTEKIRTEKRLVDDLAAAREAMEARQRLLADALATFAADRGVTIDTPEDALALILAFLERFHVSLALGDAVQLREDVPTAPDETEADRSTKLVAAFLQEIAQADSDLTEILQETLEGFVLQNALLLKDISASARRFKNLHVVCDSVLLFGALGVRGKATEIATREFFSLLRDTGAVLDVFEPTIREMRRILAVYEDRIGTPSGRASLYPSELTRYFLTNHYSPSDVAAFSSLIEHHLRGLGLNIRDIPARRPHLTLDEKELAKRLAERPGEEDVPRVVHDIDCIAGVITWRGGIVSDSLDNATAVFVTTSGLTAKNAAGWYVDQGGRGVPPITHYLTLSNVAWIKRPASAAKLKLHELVALCAAALRPSRQAWQTFLRHLKRLQESGELSSDEVTAIVASDLADRLLVDEEIDEDSDAATLSEVVERVKAAYRAEAASRVAHIEETAAATQAEALQLRLHLEGRSRRIAHVLCWLLAGLISAALLVGTAFSLLASSGGRPSLAALVFLGLLAVTGLMGVLWGFNVNAWRTMLEERLAARLRHWMTGNG